MSNLKRVKTALISVYHKDLLDGVVIKLNELGVKLYSTGGTKDFIEELGIKVTSVEELTSYPSILGGRVKTLHPKVFGGILARRSNETDKVQLEQFQIPEIDLVIVDLYPFEETVASGADEQSIIEKIDIGGISLIRAAAKNFRDVLIVSSRNQYSDLLRMLDENKGDSTLEDRRKYACEAFNISSHYDTAIFNFFNEETGLNVFKQSIVEAKTLRYGENPHQAGVFFGNFEQLFSQLNGKEISYNNLLDIDSAINLMDEFEETTFAILKHNNACGIASRENVTEAYKAALAGDPVSAYGGVLITNVIINKECASEINNLFFEIIISPGYDQDAIDILKERKNRIILVRKNVVLPKKQFRSLLNGVISQERDLRTEEEKDMTTVTKKSPAKEDINDLIFAAKVVKHSKSNAIVLSKNKQLYASGIGQTSRVDSLRQAITKAANFGFKLDGAVMASDAFFPFADCVEVANQAGISTVIQPGGSIRDKESIEYCDKHNMAMVVTGIRHFRH
jgi:phosphoribosylaminoimidazolecarboxamide formyltransferase / IMP cyclohydrolase